MAVSQVEEAPARGAAPLAPEALWTLDVAGAPPFVGELIIPDDGRQARYRQTIERQRTLYKALIDRRDADPG